MATSTKTPAKQSASLTGGAAQAVRSDHGGHERAADTAGAARRGQRQAGATAPVATVFPTVATTAITALASTTAAGKAEKGGTAVAKAAEAAKATETAKVPETAKIAEIASTAKAAETPETAQPAKTAKAAKTAHPQTKKAGEVKGKSAQSAKAAKDSKDSKEAKASDATREATTPARARAETSPATSAPLHDAVAPAPSAQPARAAPPAAAPGTQSPAPSTQPPGDGTSVATRPDYWDRACADLQKRDRILKKLIPKIGPAHLQSRGDPFVTLVRAVIGQQISVAAAQAVWQRVERACPKLAPQQFIRLGQEKLTACGVSKRKTEYLLDLAQHFASGALHVGKWTSMDDEDVIAELTQIRGIGRWTAEMFLIFNLTRPNVLPLDDLGLIRAIGMNYFSGEPVTRSEAREVAANWEPWRTVATWYMWRSLELASAQGR